MRPTNWSVTLFCVHRRGHGAVVIEAETAVAEAGWWVFRASNGDPLATVPTKEVLGIKATPPSTASRPSSA